MSSAAPESGEQAQDTCRLSVPTSVSFVRFLLKEGLEISMYTERTGVEEVCCALRDEGLYPWQAAAVVVDLAAGCRSREELRELAFEAGLVSALAWEVFRDEATDTRTREVADRVVRRWRGVTGVDEYISRAKVRRGVSHHG